MKITTDQPRIDKAITYEVIREVEDLDYTQMDYDKSTVKHIHEQYKYNEWAWCMITVRATLNGVISADSATLGGCSYRDETEFRQSLYFTDLKSEARQALHDQMEQLTPYFYANK